MKIETFGFYIHSKRETDKASNDLQLKEQKKYKIGLVEHSINKNKPVKRFSSDQEIREIVKKGIFPKFYYG